jgi:endonuclease/exonuclease/phosphatase family metal-dependent hydrolase
MSLAPFHRAGLVPLALAALACGEASPPSTSDSVPEDPDPPVTIPAMGTPATFDVATWNIKHFGEPDDGPTDDQRQLRRVRDVILGTDADLWGVQEIADERDFASLLTELPDYGGILATDPLVGDGAAQYEDFDFERKVGLVYKRAMVEVLDARIVLTDLAFEFAGRPPLEARLRVTSQGVRRDVTVVVLHTKSDDQVASWERRAAAGAGLKAHLDATWPDDPVLVLGDWNDDIDSSITPGRDSPYRPFVDDATSWVFVSAQLTAAGQTSIIGFPNVIDHILASDEAVAWYEPESARVYRVDDFIPEYVTTTSDHLPVLARFVLER